MFCWQPYLDCSLYSERLIDRMMLVLCVCRVTENITKENWIWTANFERLQSTAACCMADTTRFRRNSSSSLNDVSVTLRYAVFLNGLLHRYYVYTSYPKSCIVSFFPIFNRSQTFGVSPQTDFYYCMVIGDWWTICPYLAVLVEYNISVPWSSTTKM